MADFQLPIADLKARRNSMRQDAKKRQDAKECGESRVSDTPLPNSAHAIQLRKKIKILAIGASSTAVIGMGRGGTPPLLERILERTMKGHDV